MVTMCLVKDPTKRPTAEKLLKHQFFKTVKSPEVALKKILADLPPLWDRVKALQLKDAAQLALRKMPSSEQEAISMSEYQRGVSAWNFDIEDLKAQASLIQDDDESSEIKEDEENAKGSILEKVPSSSKCNSGKEALEDETIYRGSSPVSDDSSMRVEIPESSIASTSNNTRTDGREAKISENDLMLANEKKVVDSKSLRNVADAKKQAFSGPLILHDREKPSERSEAANIQQVASRPDTRRTTNFSGPLSLPNRASANSLSAPMRSPGGYMESMEEKSKRNVVQKGRFSVTSENVDLAKVPEIGIRKPTQGSSPLKKSASVGEWRYISKPVLAAQYSREISNSSLPSSAIVPHLQNLFQQTSFQQGLILNLLNTLQQNDRPDGAQAGISSQSHTVENDTADSASSERERILLIKISELQAKMMALTDELIGAKLKHIQLEQELNSLYSREEIETGNEEMEGA
ncbi:Protein kinase superfamily protein [Rhynchospora pubera]|uniref:Protein kinase superfamily protein n=1 Tax=Rhynchospora pubera TaxID=906938 RepID=A0AAV8ETV8_9POAL|nr:Protein kinase superfamily protein [Rhynchospora pubera]